eukprot:g10573.t1
MGAEDELSGIQRELSMFPERAFDFRHAGTIIIAQDVADVGSVVWDAEVLLAHYLDQAYGPRLNGMRVLELGSGTGLAGIVAARLGASVALTDQSKILPTLERNARSNAPDLECRHLPASPGYREARTPPAARGTDAPGGIASSAPQDPGSSAATALVGERGGCGKAELASSSATRHSDGKDAGIPWSSDAKGRWLVAELLFSDSKEELLRWRRNIVGGRGDTILGEAGGVDHGEREDGLFDLVVAADVVYLNDLWDAMAFTVKTLLKPKGEALMTFEQRRSNVDGFFGPPRFGSGGDDDAHDRDAWGQGEELDFEEGAVDGKGLGGAAKAARVRMFRMRRRVSGR